MMKKYKATISLGVVGLIISILSGISGASFAIGSSKQQILDTLNQHEYMIQEINERITTIERLEQAIYGLQADVKVLQAIVSRIENKLN